MSQCLKVPVHVLHGSKCHGGRFDLGRIVKAPLYHTVLKFAPRKTFHGQPELQ
jgi:hypothetical protein